MDLRRLKQGIRDVLLHLIPPTISHYLFPLIATSLVYGYGHINHWRLGFTIGVTIVAITAYLIGYWSGRRKVRRVGESLIHASADPGYYNAPDRLTEEFLLDQLRLQLSMTRAETRALLLRTHTRLDRPFAAERIGLIQAGYSQRPLNDEQLVARYPRQNWIMDHETVFLPQVELFRNSFTIDGAPLVGEPNIRCEFDTQPFRIDDFSDFGQMRANALKFIQAQYENGATLRLRSLSFANSELTLGFQPTYYSDYVFSHICSEVFIPERGNTVRALLEEHETRVLPQIDLSDIWRSHFANHTGVTVLLLTSDRSLILLANKSTNLTYPDSICGSASGTADISDVGCDGKANAPFSAARRELFEELRLAPRYIPELTLLAVTRDLRRAGKPEFIFLGKTFLTSKQVEREFQSYYAGPEGEVISRAAEIKNPQHSGLYVIRWDHAITPFSNIKADRFMASLGFEGAPLLNDSCKIALYYLNLLHKESPAAFEPIRVDAFARSMTTTN